MIYQKAITQVKEFIRNYFADHLNPKRIYHNLQYAENIVDSALQIANHYKLDLKSKFIIEAAAWFQVIAHLDSREPQEKKAAQLAGKFLSEIAVDEDCIKNIKSAILATRIPQQPKNLNERIVCDALMFYLGQEDFLVKSKLLRKELALMSGKKISKEIWKQQNLQLLQNHRFKTDYAQQLLADEQKKNLEILMNENVINSETVSTAGIPGEKPAGSTHTGKNNKRPGRGIETMFRISSNNHQALSQMADSKAHIMITVNSIIISVLLSVLFRNLGKDYYLTIAVAVLLIVNVITIVFSILATRPNIPSGIFSKEEIKSKNVNLLFFGNFYKMGLNEYSDGMALLMEDRDFLYNSLIKNLHQQGIVLGKKYKLLRISYNVFMYGLVVSIFAFGIAMILSQ
ncbi:Pycsar system effector family protein [Daejeonella oryzae]|uniref:Pycsar system effector family protein n=1 Tax=Daejeonella oryzae TaxID=1122943 RepID=UPI00040285AC|nr:Pycsar system effector family protein [Daejeonella oryzae]